MLHWFRTRGRICAAALLLSLGTLGASSIVPHEDDCHAGDLCVVPAAPHDPSQHSVQYAPSADEAPLHCVVCHWTRLHRRSADVLRAFVPYVERRVRFSADVSEAPAIASAAQPPLRSPPATPAPLV